VGIVHQEGQPMIRKQSFGLLAGLFITLATAAHAEITYSGGDGRTVATAVVIEGASGSSDGVASEYAWIEQNRPGAQVLNQALVQDGDKIYDLLTLRVDGRDEALYFDITGFFGNF
jgi:hypothetical protein